jgi:hypothetical protein
MNSLLSVLFSLVIGAAALYYALPMLIDAQMQPAQNDAANQIAVLEAASVSYILGNASQPPLSTIVPGAPLVLTPSSIPSIYLPATFKDFNVFGQNHAVVITQNSPGQFEALVYTYGGDTIPDTVAIRVAQSGPPNSVVYLSSDTADIEGAAGGEMIPIATFQNATHPITIGHIGAHILPASLAAEAPFLNRYATGNLDDNTMHTAQYMDGNNLTMSGADSATGGNINMAGGNVAGATQVSASQQVTTPMLADPTTPTYQLTPAGSSNINAMTVTGNLTVDGTATATTYLHLSDARLKQNIRRIDNPLAIVEALQGHKFDWRQDGKPDIGFVAQEVQTVLPEAVVTSPEGHLAVKYDVLTAPLVEAVKAQAEQIDRLNEVVSQKSAEIEQLKDVVYQLDKASH